MRKKDHNRRMARHLYGWPCYWHKLRGGWRAESSPCITIFPWPRTITQIVKMRIWQNKGQVPWYGSWKWLYPYGPCQAVCHCSLASTQTVKAVQSFLGFCNFYRKFVPGFSNTVAPLTTLIQKNQPWMWGPDQQTAFVTLLSHFQTTPILCLPDVHHPFIIMTNASLLASGGVLMQKDDNSDHHPCVYFSQMFSPAEWNYDIYDCKLLAVIHTLDHWHHYLQGMSHLVTLLTNHKNLMYFCQPQKLSCRQTQWMMFLQDFDLHFIHIPGSTMGLANALSHLVDPDTSSNHTNITLLPDNLFIHAIDTTLVDKSSTTTDPLVRPYFLISLLPTGIFLILVFISKTVFIFLPTLAMTLLPLFTHPSLPAMGGSFTPTPCHLVTTGGWVCPPLFVALSLVVPSVNRWRSIPTQLSLCSPLSPLPAPAHFRNYPLTWSPITHLLMATILCWLWSTMVFQRG